MESSIRFLSLNVGMKSDLAGVRDMILNYNLDIILIQEIRLTHDEMDSKFSEMGYSVKVNIDNDQPLKPGTAVIWNSKLPVTSVENLCLNRAQVIFINEYAVLNIYAPSGADKKNERADFFSRDIFRAIHLHSNNTRPSLKCSLVNRTWCSLWPLN